MKVTLKRATVMDAKTLVAFERKVANPKLYGQPLDGEAAIQEINQNSFYFIKRGSEIVGTAAVRRSEKDTVYISNVAVLPEFRRQGIARSAMLSLLKRSNGATRIELATHPENKAALELYSSLGFVVESRKENYFGDGEPRLILSLHKN
jgi:[ribosomal protein S18]-alanine N-acetyltransferase